MHNWDVLNWAVNAQPVRAMAMGRNDLFRDRQPDRDVHDYYTGRRRVSRQRVREYHS